MESCARVDYSRIFAPIGSRRAGLATCPTPRKIVSCTREVCDNYFTVYSTCLGRDGLTNKIGLIYNV
jgi:hypothetical protein